MNERHLNLNMLIILLILLVALSKQTRISRILAKSFIFPRTVCTCWQRENPLDRKDCTCCKITTVGGKQPFLPVSHLTYLISIPLTIVLRHINLYSSTSNSSQLPQPLFSLTLILSTSFSTPKLYHTSPFTTSQKSRRSQTIVSPFPSHFPSLTD